MDSLHKSTLLWPQVLYETFFINMGIDYRTTGDVLSVVIFPLLDSFEVRCCAVLIIIREAGTN